MRTPERGELERLGFVLSPTIVRARSAAAAIGGTAGLLARDMLKLSCLCGKIRIEIGKRPDFIHECNCAFCSKSGARWGYFHPSQVSVEGPAEGYCREDKADPGALLQFCARCGSTTHFVLTAAAKHGNVVMGVNMRLAEESDLAGIELRYPDGRAWAGEGEFGYVQEARILGRAPAHAGAADSP